MSNGKLGDSAAEVALTKHLAATLVQQEVIEPLSIAGWSHANAPSPGQAAVIIAERARAAGEPEEKIAAFLADRGVKYTPPTGGQPIAAGGAPAPVAQPAPVTSGQPAPATAPAPVAPAKTDAPDTNSAAAANLLTLFESLKDASGKYMGKYTSIEEALKGAGHLANMAKTALQRAEEASARLTAAGTVQPTSPAAVPAAAPAIKPFQPASRPTLDAAKARLAGVLAKVTDNGFDGDSAREFAEANREVAREEALAVAEEQRQRDVYAQDVESKKWAAVTSFMTEKYPDSVNVNDDEFSTFLALNPLLTEAMSALRAQGREQRAAELGYTEFVKARSGSLAGPGGMSRAEAERQETALAEREKVRLEERDKALKDAGIVHSSAGGSSAVESPGITGPSQDDINAAAAAMRREGDAPGSPAAARWRHAVIGRFLPPELFGGN